MIELLQKLGFTLNQSKVLKVLLDDHWHLMVEIEVSSDLCQPIVSITVKSLGDYIDVGHAEREGKGAPLKPVRIKSINEFLKSVHAKIYYPYIDASNAIKELRELTASHPPHNEGS